MTKRVGERAQGGGRGAPGGAGLGFADASLGGAALVLPPGMSDASSNDSLGLGGFGASAINGGFGVGAGADAGGGGRGGGGRGGAVATRMDDADPTTDSSRTSATGGERNPHIRDRFL